MSMREVMPLTATPSPLARRQRFGATLVLLGLAALTALFWVEVIRLILQA